MRRAHRLLRHRHLRESIVRIRRIDLREAEVRNDYGFTGIGQTVAVIDSGYLSLPEIETDIYGRQRVLAFYDAIADRERTPGWESLGCASFCGSTTAWFC